MHMDTQWQSVMARDSRQDGRFVFAVRTTGVYCRPSCPSRRPRRDSVEFFADARQAERAGYRPCLRCKPTQISTQVRAVTKARRLLDSAERILTLAELSAAAGVSPFYLQRIFKRATGLSPREYQSARRMSNVKQGLRKGANVTTALYDAGFGSSSRLYEKSTQHLGMTPGAYRRGGSREQISYSIAPSPLGRVLLAATAKGLCGVRFGESTGELERSLRQEFHAATIIRRRRIATLFTDGAGGDLRRASLDGFAARHSRNGVPEESLGCVAQNSTGRDAQLQRHSQGNWQIECGSSRRARVRHQSRGDRGALSSRDSQ